MVSHFSNFAGGDALLCEHKNKKKYFSCINVARYQSTNQYNTKIVFCSAHTRQINSVTSDGFVLHYRENKEKQTIVRKIIERANSEGISFGKLVWSKLAEAAERQPNLGINDTIDHDFFGKGKVISSEPHGNFSSLEIDFADGETRKINSLKVKRVKEPGTTYERTKTTGKNIVVGGVYHHYSGSDQLNRKVVDIIDKGLSAKTVVYDDVYGGGRCIKTTFCKACPTVITIPPGSLVITKRRKPKSAITQKPAESNRARVEEFMQKYPTAPVKEIAHRLELSEVTIYKHRKQIQSQRKRLVGIPRRILSNRYSKYRRG